jgi:hypothetical protein
VFLQQTSGLRRKVHSSYQRAIANTLTAMKVRHQLEDNSSGGWGAAGWGVGGGGRRGGGGCAASAQVGRRLWLHAS